MRHATIHKMAEEFYGEEPPKFPIKIIELARKRDLSVMPHPLAEVASVLFIQDGIGNIGFNPSLSRFKQRFAIAHCIGHYVLHRHINDLFVDKGFRISLEQQAGTPVNHNYERQANEFAVALLLPENILRKEVESLNLDFGEDDGVKILSKKFEVSMCAVYYRLYTLKLL